MNNLYSDFYLESIDAAVCVNCDREITFAPDNIDSLLLNLDSH